MEGVTGKNVCEQTTDTPMAYCLLDAQLCSKLLQKINYELPCILMSTKFRQGIIRIFVNQMVYLFVNILLFLVLQTKIPIESENITVSFSEPKKKLLYYLKVMQQAGLQELAQAMKVSRMAVHKHLALLQKRGLVESVETRGRVGRPRMIYQLTSESKTIFPKSYSAIATHALDFIERNMGKKGVEKVLQERQGELFDKYYRRLGNLDFDKKVRELARIRDEEGYMAEAKKESRSGRKYTLLEYNCPIIHVAESHWEACSTETELFEKLLDADVETTHRAAKGDMICKFLIKEKKEGYYL